MEKPTAFALDHAITHWRQHLSQSPQYRAENLAELESHLRDSMSVLTERGLTEDEAFLIAARRVGSSPQLEPEFAKVNGREVWLGRLFWMLAGVQAWALLTAVSSAFSRTGSQWLMVSLLRPGSAFAGTEAASFGDPVSIFFSVLFFFTDLVALATVTATCWWLLRRNRDWVAGWARRRGRLVVAAVAFCVAMLFWSTLGQAGYVWLVKNAGPATSGKVAMSMSMAALILHPLKMIALAALTVWLGRRQLQRASA